MLKTLVFKHEGRFCLCSGNVEIGLGLNQEKKIIITIRCNNCNTIYQQPYDGLKLMLEQLVND